MTEIKEVVDERNIWEILDRTSKPAAGKVMEILNKAAERKGLALEEVGYLLNTEDPEMIEKMFGVSGRIKREIYGERLVLFAPLYLSSHCVNDCEYCGFHRRNQEPRRKLTLEEIAEQVKILENMGHKRLLLEFGEHPLKSPIDYVVDVIRTIYATKSGRGEIRRVNVNIAATTVEDYEKIKEAGIGTYQLFQETYHRETYEKLHHGPKADYERQLFAHDRAMAAGIDDVGLGALYGLFDYRFDTLALVSHAQYLDRKFDVGPHTISVPRLQPAPTVDMTLFKQHEVSESRLLQIIAVLRMAIPYTGMIISTRERLEMRAKSFEIGISQTSAASCTSPGGYGRQDALQQFSTQDHRSVDETIISVIKQGLVPSFCTACYRTGRTGEKIMRLLKSGDIHNLCRPNALLTFKEWLADYATQEVRRSGEKVIDRYLNELPRALRRETRIKLERIEQGERDLYL